jgi:lauroyl/myristoyl acyltransferase
VSLKVFLLRLAGWVPLWLSARLAFGLAWLASFLPLSISSAYRTILVNLLICYPEKSFSELSKLARRSQAELAWTLVDCAQSWVQPAATSVRRVAKVHGYDALRAAMASERPALLLTLHQSSWELPNLIIGQMGAMTVFYQPAADDLLNALVTHAREGTGSTLVTADAKGVKAALGAMSRGEAVGILADHNPDKSAGNPWVDFMGQPVRTSNLPFKLLQRYQPYVFYVCAVRVKGKVEVHIIEADASLYEEKDEVAVLEKMNAGLAAMIHLAPEQYQWTYKRFHRTPEGKRPLYKKEILPLLRQLRGRTERNSLGLGAYSVESTQHLNEIMGDVRKSLP